MVYISGYREYQCRDYTRWLGLKPTEWRYVWNSMNLRGVRKCLFIELEGMYSRDRLEYWAIKDMVKVGEFIHVKVEW